MKRIISIVTMMLLAITARSPAVALNRYNGSGQAVPYVDEISYSRKVDNQSFISEKLPLYSESNLPANSCGPVAGTIVLGYYDLTYVNLIPNYTTGQWYNGQFIYYAMNTTISGVGNSLYTLMQTNVGGAGTTATGFKNGLASYVSGKGYTLTYESVMSGGKFSLSVFASKITAKRPTVLFLNAYKYTSVAGYTTQSGKDIFSGKTSTENHIAVAYGYRTINYYRLETHSVWSPVWYNPFRFITVTEEVNFRNDTYLLISFGDASIGFLNINNLNSIDDAYGVKII